jgi:hypothetical protein
MTTIDGAPQKMLPGLIAVHNKKEPLASVQDREAARRFHRAQPQEIDEGSIKQRYGVLLMTSVQ